MNWKSRNKESWKTTAALALEQFEATKDRQSALYILAAYAALKGPGRECKERKELRRAINKDEMIFTQAVRWFIREAPLWCKEWVREYDNFDPDDGLQIINRVYQRINGERMCLALEGCDMIDPDGDGRALPDFVYTDILPVRERMEAL